ncbi:hypothetical protein CEE87_12980, partial [Lactobacillus crispatus]
PSPNRICWSCDADGVSVLRDWIFVQTSEAGQNKIKLGVARTLQWRVEKVPNRNNLPQPFDALPPQARSIWR